MAAHWAAKYVGMPFVRGGRDASGVDCYGLVWMVYRDVLGIDLPTFEGTGGESPGQISARVAEESRDRWVEVSMAEELDVVSVRMGGLPIHLGIVVDAGRMLHAWDGVGARIERITGPVWRRRINGFYRYF